MRDSNYSQAMHPVCTHVDILMDIFWAWGKYCADRGGRGGERLPIAHGFCVMIDCVQFPSPFSRSSPATADRPSALGFNFRLLSPHNRALCGPGFPCPCTSQPAPRHCTSPSHRASGYPWGYSGIMGRDAPNTVSGVHHPRTLNPSKRFMVVRGGRQKFLLVIP